MEDKIAELCMNKYNELGKNGKPRDNEWTLLSGFIIEFPGHILKLVSLATGTKCIGKSKLSRTGSVLSDSHAEVLARRGLLRYLYENIELAISDNNSLLFDLSNGKYKLKHGIQFHMYCSHVPCGDASIIPKMKRNIDDDNYQHCKKFKSDNDGDIGISLVPEHEDKNKYDDIHRTGGKSITNDDSYGPGCLYHRVGLVRTKPGRGEPTLSLSCSDKIAKWIYCGLQGSLLSLLLEERINLKSITIGGGGQYCIKSMKRALVERSCCPEQYHPDIKQTKLVFQHSRYFNHQRLNPCATAIVWSDINHKALEVCVEGKKLGVTKKLSESSSRLKISRMELFIKFHQLTSWKYKNINYKDMKSKAYEYIKTFEDFRKTIGGWTDKPLSTFEFFPDLPS